MMARGGDALLRVWAWIDLQLLFAFHERRLGCVVQSDWETGAPNRSHKRKNPSPSGVCGVLSSNGTLPSYLPSPLLSSLVRLEALLFLWRLCGARSATVACLYVHALKRTRRLLPSVTVTCFYAFSATKLGAVVCM